MKFFCNITSTTEDLLFFFRGRFPAFQVGNKVLVFVGEEAEEVADLPTGQRRMVSVFFRHAEGTGRRKVALRDRLGNERVKTIPTGGVRAGGGEEDKLHGELLTAEGALEVALLFSSSPSSFFIFSFFSSFSLFTLFLCPLDFRLLKGIVFQEMGGVEGRRIYEENILLWICFLRERRRR